MASPPPTIRTITSPNCFGTSLLNELIRTEVGDVTGKSLSHLLCHIGTDTLSWALLGAHSHRDRHLATSLRYARLLAQQMGIDAQFIEADIMDVIHQVDQKFDIVFFVHRRACAGCRISGALRRPYATL